MFAAWRGRLFLRGLMRQVSVLQERLATGEIGDRSVAGQGDGHVARLRSGPPASARRQHGHTNIQTLLS